MPILIVFVALLLMPSLAAAQLKCCYQVTTIDAKSGIVSATEPSTKATLQFQVKDRLILAKLRVNQQVYADIAARQVGLDGRQACCAIVGTPVTAVTAARPATPTPTTATPAPSSQPSVRPAGAATARVPVVTTLPTISYATPYKPTSTKTMTWSRVQSRSVTAMVGGKNQSGAVLQLRGRKGIEQATSLSPGARTLLGMHVRTLAAGETATYIVNTVLADEWIKAHPVPDDMKPVEPESDGSDDCDGVWSMNCAVQTGANMVEAAWEMTVDEFERFQKRAVDAWNKGTDDLANAWETTQACFTERTLSLPNIPIQFDITPSMTVDLEQSKSKGSASGTVKGSVGLGVPMQADFAARLDLFYIPCLPFAVRPKALSADGTMTVGQELTGTVTSTGSFKKTFTIPPTGGPVIPIQVFPIVIAGVPVAEVDVSAYIEGNIEVSATGTAEGRFQLKNMQPTKFDFSCNGGGCKATSKGLPAATTTSQGAQIEGRVSVKPAIYTALQLNFNYHVLSARAGPQPYLLGVAAGCGAVAATQTAGGGSTTQTNHALTGDLDWGVELRAEALVMGTIVGNPFVKGLMQDKHIWFRDLAPGGSTAFVPVVANPPQVVAAQPTIYKVRMPTCYPYPDRVQYRVSWTGGATPAVVPGCTWQAGSGTCSVAPTKDLLISLTWPSAGNHSFTIQAVGDAHGRAFAPAPAAAQLAVSVTASP